MAEELNAIDNKIEVSQITEAVHALRNDIGTFKFNGLEIEVKNTISMFRMSQLVTKIAEGCFDPDTSEFHPEFRNMLTRVGIIALFTNIELPEDVDEQYDLLYGTTLYDEILGLIDEDFLSMMLYAIDEKIAHTAAANLSSLQKQVEEVTDKFAELTDSIEELFGGISSEDMNKLAGAIANGGIDEEKLVKAFAKQK